MLYTRWHTVSPLGVEKRAMKYTRSCSAMQRNAATTMIISAAVRAYRFSPFFHPPVTTSLIIEFSSRYCPLLRNTMTIHRKIAKSTILAIASICFSGVRCPKGVSSRFQRSMKLLSLWFPNMLMKRSSLSCTLPADASVRAAGAVPATADAVVPPSVCSTPRQQKITKHATRCSRTRTIMFIWLVVIDAVFPFPPTTRSRAAS